MENCIPLLSTLQYNSIYMSLARESHLAIYNFKRTRKFNPLRMPRSRVEPETDENTHVFHRRYTMFGEVTKKGKPKVASSIQKSLYQGDNSYDETLKMSSNLPGR